MADDRDNHESMESTSGDEEMEVVHADADVEDEDGEGTVPYLPSQQVCEGVELEMDPETYLMHHAATTGFPCLSFDIIRDNLGDKRQTFPLTAYCVSGTQADRSHTNNVVVFKLSNMHKSDTTEDDDEDSSESDEEEENEAKKPVMSAALMKHNGGVNRIRCTQLDGKTVAASWSETGKVHVWDLTTPLAAVDNPKLLASHKPNAQHPIFTFSGHQIEGFAMDWCPTSPGRLATGDCSKNIHLWQPSNGSWNVDQRPFVGHTQSVEDIQWSPNEQNVLASCSVDRSLRIWDVRAAPGKACMLSVPDAHASDINVISWNRNDPFIVSGGDDAMLKVWDLRQLQSGQAVATFKHHQSPITTVEWSPSDSTVFAAAGEDDQLTIWDLAMEPDTASTETEVKGVAPQLMFIHQGQKDMKELHFHPQLPGVVISTAASGFNIFRTFNM